MKDLIKTLGLAIGLAAPAAVAAPCAYLGGQAAIDAKRAAKPFLGAAYNEATLVPGMDGCYRHYEAGSVYWTTSATEAFEVHGDIRARWAQLGWEQSHLGYPVTDETATPDGVGRFSHFQRGSIYWKPGIGPQPVINGFRAYWAARGYERNPELGYPTNAEMPAFPVTADRYQDFENGVLYYVHRTGAIYEMSAFPPASRAKEDLEGELGTMIDGMLANAGGDAYRDGAVSIASVTDYRNDGLGGAKNRALVVHVGLKYTASFLGIDDALPDPSTSLALVIRIDGRRRFEGDALIYSVLERWSASTHVPFPTSAFISAATINARLAGELDPAIGVERQLGVLPSPFVMMSTKVTAEGGLAVYVAPLD